MRDGVSGVVVALGIVSFACAPVAPRANAVVRQQETGLERELVFM
jgi:hypothetical protein